MFKSFHSCSPYLINSVFKNKSRNIGDIFFLLSVIIIINYKILRIVFQGLCVMDVFLAGPQVCACQGGSNHHHPSCHVRPSSSSSSSSSTSLSPSTFSMPRSSIPTEELFRSTTTSRINSSLPPVAYTKVKNWIIAKKWNSKVSVRIIFSQESDNKTSHLRQSMCGTTFVSLLSSLLSLSMLLSTTPPGLMPGGTTMFSQSDVAFLNCWIMLLIAFLCGKGNSKPASLVCWS